MMASLVNLLLKQAEQQARLPRDLRADRRYWAQCRQKNGPTWKTRPPT